MRWLLRRRRRRLTRVITAYPPPKAPDGERRDDRVDCEKSTHDEYEKYAGTQQDEHLIQDIDGIGQLPGDSADQLAAVPGDLNVIWLIQCSPIHLAAEIRARRISDAGADP